jgi:hypothetical protein
VAAVSRARLRDATRGRPNADRTENVTSSRMD